MIYIFLAKGFEEIEAVAPIDILRKAGLKVTTVGIGDTVIPGNVGLKILADIKDTEFNPEDASAIIIPGGYGGAKRLAQSQIVLSAIKQCYEKDGIIGAICAGPSVLAKAGVLNNKKITCYPGIEDKIESKTVKILKKDVVTDGNIVTAIGPGAALKFAYTLVSVILNKEKSLDLQQSMCYSFNSLISFTA